MSKRLESRAGRPVRCNGGMARRVVTDAYDTDPATGLEYLRAVAEAVEISIDGKNWRTAAERMEWERGRKLLPLRVYAACAAEQLEGDDL